MLFFDHQNKKHTNILLFYTIFFARSQRGIFLLFPLSLLFQNFTFFQKFSKFYTFFLLFENRTIESVHTYWHIDFLRKSVITAEAQRGGLLKKRIQEKMLSKNTKAGNTHFLSIYCTCTITTLSWFETALDYKLRILGPKIEDFPCLLHKLSVTLTTL